MLNKSLYNVIRIRPYLSVLEIYDQSLKLTRYNMVITDMEEGALILFCSTFDVHIVTSFLVLAKKLKSDDIFF